MGQFSYDERPVAGSPITTEQVLRRLYILGYTAEDDPIRRTIERMILCIKGEQEIDDCYERKHDLDRELSGKVRRFPGTQNKMRWEERYG